MLERTKLVILDFDGTIADSKEMVFQGFQEVLENHGYHRNFHEIKKHVKGRGFVKDIGSLLPLKNQRKEKVLISKLRREFNKIKKRNNKKMALRKGTKDFLKFLNERKIRVVLLSNSDAVFIRHYLNQHKILKYFLRVIGIDSGFESKVSAGRFLLKKYGLNPKDALYIGDTPYDIETAKTIGCPIASISGWYSEKELRKNKPNMLIRSFEDLMKSK